MLQDQDETLTAAGLSTGFLRTYNSQGTVTGVGQDGFVTGYERRVTGLTGTVNQPSSTVRRVGADGSEAVFTWDATRSAYVSAVGSGAHDTLVFDGTVWTWTEGSTRSQEVFDSTGKLTALRDGLSGAQYNVDYLGSKVVSVLSTTGDGLLFGYGTNDRLTSVSTREGGIDRVQVAYGYDGHGRLEWVQHDLTPNDVMGTWGGANDGLRFRTTYTYVENLADDLRIASVTQSDGTVVSYTYHGGAGSRIKTVTLGTGGDAQTLTFDYDVYSANSTNVKDAQNQVWTYQYDANKQLTAVLGPEMGGQRDITTYTYDGSGNVLQARTERGASLLSKVEYEVDTSSGNVLWQWNWTSASGAQATQRTYTSANQLATETVYTGLDSNGAVAGGLDLGTGLTRRYFYDDQNRLRFAVDATGSVRELTYHGGGNGIGQLASERRYTGALYSGSWDTAAVGVWAGQSAQQAASQLTTYTYDAKGRLQETVAYAMVQDALQSTPGAGVLDDATDITRYAYDAQGLLRQQVMVRGTGRSLNSANPLATSEVTDYVYDGLGRLLSVLKRDVATTGTAPDKIADPVGYAAWDAITHLTAYAYADSVRQVVVTLDTDATRTQTLSTAGRVVSVSEAGAGQGTRTTQNYFNADGDLRATEDAAGGRRYFFYDDKGRVEAEVDATGAVVRHQYDGADRRLSSTQYANRVTTSGWIVGGAVVPANFAAIGVVTDALNDRVSTRTFDQLGRVATETDAAGLVTTYAYDGAGRLRSTTVSKPGDGSVVPRVSYRLYDAADRLLATVDAGGYVTENVYDAGGRLAKVIAYATASSSPAATTLASLRPSTHANDQTTRYFYNGRGQLIGTLNAEGYLSEAIIDEAGNTRAERTYAEQLTGLSGTESFATLRTNAQTNSLTEKYRETKTAYNGLGQRVTQTNAEGTVTRFYYDEPGRLVRTVAAENASTATDIRENFRRYNVFDELVGEISGEQALQVTAGLSEEQLDAVYAQYGTRHKYDALGRLIESIGPAGAGVSGDGDKVWYFYEDHGRIQFTVRGVAQDNNGTTVGRNTHAEVTETRYSAFGDVIDRLTYTGRMAIPVAGDRASVATLLVPAMLASAISSRRQYSYDTRGLLAQMTDATSAITTYSYTAFGQLYDTTAAFGTTVASTSRNTYDVRGQLSSRIDGLGTSAQRSTYQVVDAFGRVTSATDGRGNPTTFTYDRLGRQITRSQSVTSEGVARAETWITSYDAFDRVLTQTDPLGKATHYTYDTTARSVTVTTHEGVKVQTVHNRHGQTVTVTTAYNTPQAASTITEYDRNGAVKRTTNALGQDGENTYDVRGLLAETTDASDRKVAYTYDAAGRVLSRIEDPGAGKLNLTTTYVYDAQGRQLTVTDASGRITAMSYDGEGRLLQTSQDPSGLNLRTTYTYDAQGRQITVTEGYGTTAARTTQYVYNALGQRTSEIVDPGAGKLNLATSYLYDGNGNAVQRTDASGRITRFVYDEANRQTHAVDAAGGVTRTIYDPTGRIVASRQYAVAITVSDLSTTTGVSAATIKARIDAIADDARDQVQYRVYDADGRLRYSVDGLGNTESLAYDLTNRVVQNKRYVTALSLSAGDKAALQAGSMAVATLDGRVSGQEATAQTTWSVFDAAGRLRFSIDALGGVTETRYDAAGRTLDTLGYTAPITVSATLKTKLATGDATALSDVSSQLASRQTLVWDNGFEYAPTAGFNSSQWIFPNFANGEAVIDRNPATTVWVAPILLSDVRPFLADGITYSAELRTGASVAGTSLLMGIQNEVQYATAGFYRDTISVEDGKLYRHQFNGTTPTTIELMTLATNTTYIVETETAADHVTTYVYVKGTDRSQGVSFTRQISSATYGRTFWYAHGLHGPGISGEAVYLDNLSATTQAHAQVQGQRYDGAGRLVRTIDALGQVEEVTYDAAGLRQSVTDALGHTTRYVHDQAGRVQYVLSPLDGQTSAVSERRYDAAGRVIAEIRYASAIASNTSNVTAALNALQASEPDQHRITHYAYDASGRLRFTVDDAGAVSEQRYDARGLVVETRKYLWPITVGSVAVTETTVSGLLGPYAEYRDTHRTYDEVGRLTHLTNALEQTEVYGYNALGQRTSFTNALNHQWTYVYDAAGRQIEERTPPVAVARYDGSGALVLGAPEVLVTRLEHDALGHVTRRIEAYGTAEARSTQYEYDQLGRQVRTIFPPAGSVNASGQFVAGTGEGPDTAVTYDALGRAVVERDVLDHYRYKVYDAAGRVAYDIDAEGYVTAYGYNALDQQISLTRYANRLGMPVGWSAGQALSLEQMKSGGLPVASTADRTIVTHYDAQGRKARVALPKVDYVRADGSLSLIASGGGASPETTFTYNAYGEVIEEAVLLERASDGTPTWARTTHYYDDLGRRHMTVDAAGYVSTWTYNDLGEMVQQTEYARALRAGTWTTASVPTAPTAGDADIGYDRTTYYGYDALGRRVLEGATRHAHDAQGQRILDTVETVTEYDAAGRNTATIVDGQRTETTFDALGRVTATKEAARDALMANWQSQLQSTASYFLDSAALHRTVSPYTAMAYDAFGNAVRTIRYADGWQSGGPVANATEDQTSTARYDQQGRVVIETDALGVQRYREYDAADRVTKVWYDLTRGSDSSVWRVTSTHTYDHNGQQLTTVVSRQLYVAGSASGSPVNDQIVQVRYNAFGEIASKGADLSTGALPEVWTYDLAGRVAATNTESGSTRTYGYNLAGHQLREVRKAYLDTGNTNVDVTLTVTTDVLGRVTQQALPAHSTAGQATYVTKAYDRWGNVLVQIDPRGYVTRYEYNALNQVVREVQPLVKIVSEAGIESWERPEQLWFFDGLGRQIGTRDANGNLRRVVYDAQGRQIGALDAYGNLTRLAYDGQGRQVAKQDALGYVTYQEFDRLNRATAHGDFLVNLAGTAREKKVMEAYVLNANGDRIQVTLAPNQLAINSVVTEHTSRYDYDSQQQLLRSQSAGGVTQTYAYDVQGRKVLETTGIGADQMTWSYDYFGRVNDHDDLAGNDSDYTYALSGQLTQQTGTATASGGNLTNWGNLESIGPAYQHLSAQSQNRHFSYYANGQVRQVSDVNGGTYTYEYDANGNRTLEETQTIDGRGTAVHVRTRIYYDSHNRIERVTTDDVLTGARKFDLRYSYDAVGNRRQVVSMTGYGPTGAVSFNTANLAPVVVGAPAPVTISAGVAREFRLPISELFHDADYDTLDVSLRMAGGGALPAWLSAAIDPATRQLVITASASSNDALGNTLALEIIADDNVNAAVLVTPLTLKIDNPQAPTPLEQEAVQWVLTPGADWSRVLVARDWFAGVEQQSVSMNVLSMVKLGPNGGALPGLVAWLGASAQADTLSLSGSPVSADQGDYLMTVAVVNGYGQTAIRFIRITVAEPVAPLANQLLPVKIQVGYGFTFERRLSEVFDDHGRGDLQISATMANGNPLPAWMQWQVDWENTPPSLRLTGEPPVDTALGTNYTVRLTATNAAGQSAYSDLLLTTTLRPMSTTMFDWAQFSIPTPIDVTWVEGQAGTFRLPQGIFGALESEALSTYVVTDLYNQPIPVPDWLHYDGNTRTLSGTPTPAADGSQQEVTVYIHAVADNGASPGSELFGSAIVKIKVIDNVGGPRQQVAFNPYSAVVSQPWTYQLPANMFVDPDGGALTYSAITPSGFGFTNNAGVLTFSGTATSEGQKAFSLLVTDDEGHTRKFNFSLTVNLFDQAPVFVGTLPNQAIDIAAAWTYTIPAGTFVDSEGTAIVYSAVQVNSSGAEVALPSGLTMSAGGTLVWNNPKPSANSLYVIRVKATAGTGWATKDFVLVTKPPGNQAPVVDYPIAQQFRTHGQPWELTVPSHTFRDPDGTTMLYSATLATGAALPGWLNFDSTTRKFTINANNNNANNASGTYTIRVQARDGNGAGARAVTTFTLWMNPDANTVAPMVSSPVQTQTVTVGTAWTGFALPADTFRENAGNSNLIYSLVGGPSWLTFNPTPSSRLFGGTPTQAGTYTVSVRATNHLGNSVGHSFKLIVLGAAGNQAPQLQGSIGTQSATVGQEWSVPVLSQLFTDPEGQPLRYEVDLVGGSPLPSWMTFDPVERYEFGQAAHRRVYGTPPTAGSWTVRVKAIDVSGGSSTTTFVVNAAAPATNQAPQAVQGSASYYTSGRGYFAFTLPEGLFSDEAAAHLSFSIAGSGGGALPSVIRGFDVATRTVWGQWKTNISNQQAVLTLTATDAAGASANMQLTLRQGNVYYPLDYFYNEADGGGFEGGPGGFGAFDGAVDNSVTQTVVVGSPQRTETYFFTYDAENRVQIQNGILADGRIILAPSDSLEQFVEYVNGQDYRADSFENRYDAVGRVVARVSNVGGYVEMPYVGTGGTRPEVVFQNLVYDQRGQLVTTFSLRPDQLSVGNGAGAVVWNSGAYERRYYDAAGRLLEVRQYFDTYRPEPLLYPELAGYGITGSNVDWIRGWLRHAEVTTYNIDGQVTSQASYGREEQTYGSNQQPLANSPHWIKAVLQAESNDPLAMRTRQSTDRSALSLLSSTTFTYNSGRLQTMVMAHAKWEAGVENSAARDMQVANFTHSFTYSYLKRDSYLEQVVDGVSLGNSNFKPTSTISYYDAYGRRLAVKEHTRNNSVLDTVRYFSYDGEDRILTRRDGYLEGSTFKQDDPNPQGDDATKIRRNNQHFALANGNQLARINGDGQGDALGGLTAYSQADTGRGRYLVQNGDNLRTVAQKVYGNAALWYVLAEANALSDSESLTAGTLLSTPALAAVRNDASTFKPYSVSEVIGSTTPTLPYIPGPTCVQQVGMMIATIVRIVSTYMAMATGQFWAAAAIGAMGEVAAQAVEIGMGVREEFSGGSILGAGLMAGIGSKFPNFGGKGVGFGGKFIKAAAQSVTKNLATTAFSKALGEDTNFSWKNIAVGAITSGLVNGIFGRDLNNPAASGTGASTLDDELATVAKSFSWSKVAFEAVSAVAIERATRKLITGHAGKFDAASSFSQAVGSVIGTYVGGKIQAQMELERKNSAAIKVKEVADELRSKQSDTGDIFDAAVAWLEEAAPIDEAQLKYADENPELEFARGRITSHKEAVSNWRTRLDHLRDESSKLGFPNKTIFGAEIADLLALRSVLRHAEVNYQLGTPGHSYQSVEEARVIWSSNAALLFAGSNLNTYMDGIRDDPALDLFAKNEAINQIGVYATAALAQLDFVNVVRTKAGSVTPTSGFSALLKKVDRYIVSNRLTIPDSGFYATDSNMRAGVALRGMLGEGPEGSIEGYSLNTGVVDRTGDTHAPKGRVNLAGRHTVPDVPDGYGHIGTVVVSRAFSDYLGDELTDFISNQTDPDPDEAMPSAFTLQPGVPEYRRSNGKLDKYSQSQVSRSNSLSGPGIARAGGADALGDALEFLQQSLNEAGLARLKAANVMQFDVYRNEPTGERLFVATQRVYRQLDSKLYEYQLIQVPRSNYLYQQIIAPKSSEQP